MHKDQEPKQKAQMCLSKDTNLSHFRLIVKFATKSRKYALSVRRQNIWKVPTDRAATFGKWEGKRRTMQSNPLGIHNSYSIH